MKPTEFFVTTLIFAAAVILTAVLATASLRAAGPSTLREPQGRPEQGRGTTSSGPPRPFDELKVGGGEQLAPPPTPAGLTAQQARGKYLVDIMGCHDCHTPMKMGPNGPQWDMDRALSGHPEQVTMPPAPAVPGPWMMVAAATMTAWTGPWGTSFTMNLTPDKETGLGDWTVDQFIATMKTGKDRGKGRPILPPMPVQNLAQLSDEDIRSLFAYLQTLKPIKNRVPQPIDPPDTIK